MGEQASAEHSSPTSPHPSHGIMIVAGEASGDKHGAALARSLAELHPGTGVEMFGSGGDEMRAAGVETLIDAREVAIIGVPEIIKAFGKLYGAYKTLLAAARTRKPGVVVLIDWPDFNMRLARRLHREGFTVVYYISPQVWAWRKYRLHAIRRDVDRMLVILPFEEQFYKDAGIEAEYVGHPLVEAVRATATRVEYCSRHGLQPERPLIALLPGSRKKEVFYHLPPMLDAARRLRNAAAISFNEVHSDMQTSIGAAQFVVPLASTIDREQVDEIHRRLDRSGDIDIKIVEQDTYNTLFHSAFAVVASGTATVEAALAGVPMVIVYRGSELNWRLIRPLIHLDTFGMVNLIAGRRIVPELMQHDATGEKIASEVTALLTSPERLSRMKQDLAEVRRRLMAGGGSASHRAALEVLRAIGNLKSAIPGTYSPSSS